MKLKINKTFLLLFAIFLITLFFRFFNYINRWGIASDQARDAIVSSYAIANNSLPLIGPFSASGPFVFGPFMYWFLIIVGHILGFSYLGYWIGLTFFSSLMAFLMFLVGKEIKDNFTGLLLAFFNAISTMQNNLATNLTESALAGIFSVFSLYFFIRSVKYGSFANDFFLGLFTALAINTHPQSIPLGLLLLASILISRNVKKISFLILGFVIPFIPLAIFDLQSNFYESKNILGYFLTAHSSGTEVPKRWLTYLSQTWPQFWSLMLGGNFYISVGLVLLTVLVFLYAIYKKDIQKPILSLAIIYAFIFIILRYFPGQLFGDFVAFLVPLFLILVTWAVVKIKQLNLYAGILIIAVISLTSIYSTFNAINMATNYSWPNAKKLENVLVQEFPKNTKFSVYDFGHTNTQISYPLVYALYLDGKINDSGQKIGINSQIMPGYQLNYFEKDRYTAFFYTLGQNDKTLVKNGWVNVNPSNIYKSVENWYKSDSGK